MERTDDLVRLRLPWEPLSGQLVRLVVYLVASRMHFDLAGLEDLSLAVDEAFSYTAAQASRGSSLEVEIGPGKEYLEIVLKADLAENGKARAVMPESLSRMIMQSVVDDVELQREETSCRIALRKKRPR